MAATLNTRQETCLPNPAVASYCNNGVLTLPTSVVQVTWKKKAGQKKELVNLWPFDTSYQGHHRERAMKIPLHNCMSMSANCMCEDQHYAGL